MSQSQEPDNRSPEGLGDELEQARKSEEDDRRRQRIGMWIGGIAIAVAALVHHFSKSNVNPADAPQNGKMEQKEGDDDPIKLFFLAGQSYSKGDWANTVRFADLALGKKEGLTADHQFAALIFRGLAQYEMVNFNGAEKSLNEALKFKPDARAHSKLSMMHIARGEEKEAVDLLNKNMAIYGKPGQYTAEQLIKVVGADLNNLSWIHGTSGNNTLHNPQLALQYATKAVQLSPSVMTLDTYAAALAANGRFKEAAEVEIAAIKMLKEGAEKTKSPVPQQLLDTFEERKNLYIEGKPYRQTPANAPAKKSERAAPAETLNKPQS